MFETLVLFVLVVSFLLTNCEPEVTLILVRGAGGGCSPLFVFADDEEDDDVFVKFTLLLVVLVFKFELLFNVLLLPFVFELFVLVELFNAVFCLLLLLFGSSVLDITLLFIVELFEDDDGDVLSFSNCFAFDVPLDGCFLSFIVFFKLFVSLESFEAFGVVVVEVELFELMFVFDCCDALIAPYFNFLFNCYYFS